jgi:GNAT superfamily N-acetyltransferase
MEERTTMRSMVSVRAAVVDDVEGLVRLTEEAAVAPARTKLPVDPRERYLQLLASPNRVVLVAVDPRIDRLVGVIVASADEIGALVPVPALIVTHLVVERTERRRGIGRALLAGVVRHADELGIDQIVVAVTTNDRDANRYLARLGFAPLVLRRVAPTSTLRRSLGMTDSVDRAVARRRTRMRSALAARVVSRGV